METMSQEIITHTLKDIQSDVKEIKLQTTRTNGRVTALENSKAYFLGALGIITMIVVPIFLYMLYNIGK